MSIWKKLKSVLNPRVTSNNSIKSQQFFGYILYDIRETCVCTTDMSSCTYDADSVKSTSFSQDEMEVLFKNGNRYVFMRSKITRINHTVRIGHKRTLVGEIW